MAYKLEDVNTCTKKILFTYESLDLSEQIGAALKEKQKSSNLKGFRKGKAPKELVSQLYGPQIESDAINRFVQKEFFDAITKEDLKVVGHPSFDNMKYEGGKEMSFDALVEIFPVFELKPFEGYSFEKEKIEVGDEDLESVRKNYLNSKAEMKEVADENAALATGHFAILNFEGEKEDGERPENMKGEEFQLEIGSGQFIPGFEDGMIGLKSGEKKTIEVTFPSEYHAEELRDAKVKFHVELLEIKEKVFPDFTDELAKEFGYESLEDFNAKNLDSIRAHKERSVNEKLHQEILEKLVEDNQFDLPNALVAQQQDYLKKDIERTLQQQGFDEKMTEEYFSKWSDDMTQKAVFQVRSGLILDKLANELKIETREEDIDKKIEETAKSSGMDPEQVKKYYTSNNELKKNLTYAIREEKTFEAIKEKMNISEK